MDELGFQEEVAGFLAAHAEPRADRGFVWGEGSDRIPLLEEQDEADERARIAAARAFRAQRFDAGLGWISGPARHGGRDLPFAYELIYRELEEGYAVPDDSCFSIGLGMVGPTILAYGSEAARDEFLSALFRADVIACQLFSEPEAGSDLANVTSRAVRDGDGWVLDGHKVWTSNAHLSDVGEIICRTNPDVPKHRGLTAFLVDMRSPGVTVRPLRQLTGGSAFSEVFLEGVRVPDERRLGDVDDGWRVALATLTNERAAIGVGLAGGNAYVELERVAETIRRAGRAGDSVVRDRFGDLCVRLRVADHLGRQAMSAVRAGQQPGPELSLAKLATSSNLVATAELMADVLGPQVAADTGSWGTYAWSEFLLAVPGVRIGGGTDEIQRNIIAERVLGLPKG